MATLDSDDLDAIAGLIAAVITTGDMEGIRHRLGLDGTATAPTAAGARLGDLELTQMKIDSSAEVGKIPLRLISDDGTSFEFADTFHGQSMSWSAEENALVVGNILANLLGKVLGQGSGVITGVGVQADVSSASTSAIRDGLATGAKQEEILGAIGGVEGGSGGGLTGDYTLTVTVTDADDSAPIENATVTLSRTGERGAELTDVNGVAVVGLDAATWSWIVRAAGYESRTGTVVVSGDAALSVEMDGIIATEPAVAPLCAVTLPVVDQYGTRLFGVSVAFKFAGLQPNADPGAVIMSPPPPQASDGEGLVQVNLIRLARYTATYKHEGETRNIAITVPDAGSFVVVEG
jgi:hypothetical protein